MRSERRNQKLDIRAGERGMSPQLDNGSHVEASGPSTPSTLGEELILRNGSRLSSPVHISKTGAFNEYFQGLPSCSMTGLLEDLDQATSRLDQGREFSMLAQGFEALASSRTTVLLLHVFERFESSTTDSLTYLSVTAPLCLALDQPPQNNHQALVLETLVYHVAINSVFRPSYLRHYHDLTKIISLWSRSPVLESDGNLRGYVKAGLSAWLPIELFDILFKVSHLLHHRLSVAPSDMQARLQELRSRLNECQLGYREDPEQLEPIPAGQTLYLLARVRSGLTSLLWAITILGTGMTTIKSQDLIVLQAEAMNHFAGVRAVRSVVGFLSHTWGPRPLGRFAGGLKEQSHAVADGEKTFLLGLDILFEESAQNGDSVENGRLLDINSVIVLHEFNF
ncbi:sterol uptake control 2 [Fusarium denticulatum]|uniref:Sterol uptake control 2 n=1 Tax=Fusarium denticulatum TaxID=48507 RepID=A0A8H6CU22_9HYPO|nr:sterol uptake control 2 [Fusarium denticulatum]